MNNEMYKLYQLMEFFVINHHYKTIAVRSLVRRDEIWLANPDNIGCEIIRLTKASLEYIENDEERINQYIAAIKTTIRCNSATFFDIHVGKEEVYEEEIFNTVMVDEDYYDGLEIGDHFPNFKNIIHHVDDNDAELKRIISNINATVLAEQKQKMAIKSSKFHLTYYIMAICILSFVVSYLLSQKYDLISTYILLGADYRPFTLGLHQYWRLLTVAFNHGGIMHLTMNMYSLMILGRYFEDKYGKVKFLIALFTSVLLGQLTSGVLSETVLTVGISGGLYGLMAFFLMDMFKNPFVSKQSLYPMILINLMINFTGNVSWAAHLGGFIAGLLLYYIFEQKNKMLIAILVLLIVFAFLRLISLEVGAIFPGTDMEIVKIFSDFGFKGVAENMTRKLLDLYSLIGG